MRPISEATSRVTGQSCSRKYIALGRIVNSWNEIVGDELAKKAQPAKLNYIKREKSGNPVAILEIATDSADATLLHYQKDLILERINRIFGEGWVTGIKFVNNASSDLKAPRRKSKKALTEEGKNYLSDILDTVEDEDMKARLDSLGKSILTESVP